MIVGFMLAGILAGLVTSVGSLFVGYGFLAALTIYAGTGFLTTLGGAILSRTLHDMGPHAMPLGA